MSVTILSPVATLRHCSDIFLKAGQESAAHFANKMADDAADLNGHTPGLGDALYRTWTAQMVERAERINRSKL
jgi:hypothetical protein